MSEEQLADQETIKQMSLLQTDFFVDLITSMRQEIRNQKQIRNSIIILKFIFLKLAIATLTLDTKIENLKYYFTILSLTIVYLDLIACQKVVAIKRVGKYFRERLEPILESMCENRKKHNMNSCKNNEFSFFFWETYLEMDKLFFKKSMLWTVVLSNIFLPLFLIFVSFVLELYPMPCFETITLMGILCICFILDVIYNLKGAGIIKGDIQ